MLNNCKKMKKHKQKLTAEEKAILNAYESGKSRSVPKLAAEKKRVKNIAKDDRNKNHHIANNHKLALRDGLSHILSPSTHEILTWYLPAHPDYQGSQMDTHLFFKNARQHRCRNIYRWINSPCRITFIGMIFIGWVFIGADPVTIMLLHRTHSVAQIRNKSICFS